MRTVGAPGMGGSLGQCAVCGDNFLKEVMMNQGVEQFTMTAFPNQMMYCHDKCKAILKELFDGSKDWHDLPDGPIKNAFEESELTKEKR